MRCDMPRVKCYVWNVRCVSSACRVCVCVKCMRGSSLSPGRHSNKTIYCVIVLRRSEINTLCLPDLGGRIRETEKNAQAWVKTSRSYMLLSSTQLESYRSILCVE